FEQLPRVDGVAREQPHGPVREAFRHLPRGCVGEARPAPTGESADFEHERRQIRVLQLINAYRFQGHRVADISPLGREPEEVPELTLEYHALSEQDLNTFFNTGSLAGPDVATLGDIIALLRRTYTHHIGWEYMHILGTEEKRWLQFRIESVAASPDYSPNFKRFIIERLTQAEGLEHYLHTHYVGQKRFSLEGGESLIPLLDELIQRAGRQGVREVVIGMAHRGRLNVLINVMGKSPAELFAEFEGRNSVGERSGDVKYHQGFSSDIETRGGPVHVALAFNPSHLEIVGPVVEGSVRARQDRRGDSEGREVLPVVLHGDAALAGQGVVQETLNMSQTRGFSTKGTVHVVVNNQIGFTTSFRGDARSTFYATDVAKMINAPIFHVNGDDPEAVMFATQVALDYRMAFRKDVFIDLVCYRRHGHNEADEPAVTQPLMYRRIRSMPTTRERYARQLVEEGVLSEDEPGQMVRRAREALERGEPVVPHLLHEPPPDLHRVDWKRYIGHEWDEPAETGVERARLQTLGERLLDLPEGFVVHPRVQRILDDRRAMLAGDKAVDWGWAETLAYATLVEEGWRVRLSGQDSGRGTFFHRHAVLHDQNTGETLVPLRTLTDPPRFLVIDSLLSEEGVLAFEYGYATTEPDCLTIWEAQFGDFANNAQVVIDQFITSGEQKWGRLCGLTLFLPHGFEGQGPEHSSARLERWLQLSAQHNIQVCQPTTASQCFHLLRRQMIRPYRKPLVVMTPKSLLRHPDAGSPLEALEQGAFACVIDETEALDPARAERILLCSGKVYYDLLARRREKGLDTVVIVRIEQLYPFPERALANVLARYPADAEVFWVQEEPLNQGAWYNIQHHIRHILGRERWLQHVTRPAAAAPATGYYSVHVREQRALVNRALGLAEDEE
ncbi:MAG: 2-oxoglutarate dehydrogenase E1 component, partial [Gammaproteobacteria bacterium]